MISTYTVLVDANVLFSKHLRSLLAFMAQTKMFRARWTEDVHQEWTRNVAQKFDIEKSKLDKQVALLNRAIPGSLVTGYDGLIDGLQLPDPNDRHVLAAAIRTNADAILTFNEKDFPQDYLDQFGIETQHPDQFFIDQFGISNKLFINGVTDDYLHYEPRMPFDEYIAKLEKAGVPQTGKLIEKLRVAITRPSE